MAIALGVGVAEKQLSHSGSSVLDQTNAFDKAEVDDVYLGQTNMITVSSFCGPHGSIWGYHLAKQKLKPHGLIPSGTFSYKGKSIKVLSAAPLIDASRSLLGTVNHKIFPILAGSHIPCANKSIMDSGPCILYGAIGIGIPKNSEIDACLMMEDVGHIPLGMSPKELDNSKRQILESMVKSIILISNNQKIEYDQVMIEIKETIVSESEVGCALVAAPYLTLAQNAIPKQGINSLLNMTLQEWQNSIQ